MDFTDLGKYLIQQRELRGLSREDVSRETKIPPSLLMALETGQAERLPSRVFVINFLKAYANAVGLEQDEVLLRYEEVAGVEEPEPSEPESRGLAERKRRLQRIAMVVVLAVAATGAAFWILKLGGG